MDFDEMLHILQHNDEHEGLELKENIDAEQIGPAIAGFATGKGGLILLGVTDDKVPVGINYSDKDKQKIIDIANSVAPAVHVDCNEILFDGGSKCVFEVYVPNGVAPFYSYRGIPYLQDGNTTRKLSQQETFDLNIRKNSISFDKNLARNVDRFATIADISEQALDEYIKEVERARSRIIPRVSTKQTLSNMNLLSEDDLVPNNAAMMMFGKEPKRFVQHSRINLCVFPGDDVATDMLAKYDIEDNSLNMIRQAENFIRKHTRQVSTIQGFKRIDVSEYPYVALREAIINAIVHRDYFNASSDVSIKVFFNRITITNPGGTSKDILKKIMDGVPITSRRNPMLAELLDSINYMERAGTGILRMKTVMKAHGLPEPVFDITENWFTVTFFGPGQDIFKLSNTSGKETDLSFLNNRQAATLKALLERQKEFITPKDYTKEHNINYQTALRDIRDMSDRGLLIKRGAGPSTRYFVA